MPIVTPSSMQAQKSDRLLEPQLLVSVETNTIIHGHDFVSHRHD